jgi:DNA excision repair protein ERCC-2
VSAAWSYTVSVRALCEFTAKQGDLDRRFTPAATALEGLQGQQAVARGRGADYETEVSLDGLYGPLRVRGRADGYDPRRSCLEEIKTLRGHPDEMPANRRRLHWAQLQTYGALFCAQRGLAQVHLGLVYFDIATQSEVVLRQLYGADELQALFEARCSAFLAWAQQEALHRSARDAALPQLALPQPAFRPGQRALAEAVYRAAVSSRCLVAQAPTGIGKTLGTLFPLLRAMPGQGIDKIAFLTCKGTGRVTALDALASLRRATPGQALRVLAIVPKRQGCEHPDLACHPESCPLARGFYDRLPAARQEAVDLGWLDAESQRRIALAHGICPYYLGQELLRWADVLVGDVHHLFDTHGQLWGLMQALDWRLAVLVDEAHNLIERTRAMYSAELALASLQAAEPLAPAAVAPALQALLQAACDLLPTPPQPHAVLASVPDAFTQALQAASAALGDHFHRQPLAQGNLLALHFQLLRLLRLVDALDGHALFDITQDPGTPGSAVLGVRNVAPAGFLRARWQALHSATLFSATLAPPEHAMRLLGLPAPTGWIEVPPAFPPDHLVVQVADGLSTRLPDRDRSLQRLVGLLAQQFDRQPGNYLAFFSSFDYLDKAAAALVQQRPDIAQWRQDRQMGNAARDAFLARFQPHGSGIAFAVLGGVFAEGVDLPGSLLIGAFVATLGLPPVSPLQTAMQQRLAALFGDTAGDADLVPAMQKVVQAAGRVLRTPQDRGWLWLMDERYRRPEVRALLPAWWAIRPLPTLARAGLDSTAP